MKPGGLKYKVFVNEKVHTSVNGAIWCAIIGGDTYLHVLLYETNFRMVFFPFSHPRIPNRIHIVTHLVSSVGYVSKFDKWGNSENEQSYIHVLVAVHVHVPNFSNLVIYNVHVHVHVYYSYIVHCIIVTRLFRGWGSPEISLPLSLFSLPWIC